MLLPCSFSQRSYHLDMYFNKLRGKIKRKTWNTKKMFLYTFIQNKRKSLDSRLAPVKMMVIRRRWDRVELMILNV